MLILADPTRPDYIWGFVEVTKIVKYATVYSGYWLMLIAIMLASTIFPSMDSAVYSTFYDGSAHESENKAWLGWTVTFGYLAYVTVSTIV